MMDNVWKKTNNIINKKQFWKLGFHYPHWALRRRKFWVGVELKAQSYLKQRSTLNIYLKQKHLVVVSFSIQLFSNLFYKKRETRKCHEWRHKNLFYRGFLSHFLISSFLYRHISMTSPMKLSAVSKKYFKYILVFGWWCVKIWARQQRIICDQALN